MIKTSSKPHKSGFVSIIGNPNVGKPTFMNATVGEKLSIVTPFAEAYYPKDSITDKPEQFFAREIVREKILKFYDKEEPYSIEVVIESFVEENSLIKVDCIIFTERVKRLFC